MKWGEKKPKREEKEEEEHSGRKVGPGLNARELDASHSGAKLGARVNSVEPPGRSSTVPRSSALGTLAPRCVSSAPASMAPS